MFLHFNQAKACSLAIESFLEQLFSLFVRSVPFRVRIPHNNTIRTVERSLLAADTDGYANAKSGTVRDCAGKSSGKDYRDMSTSHSQSLSSRSLGGLDGAAALPGATACGRQSYGSLEYRRQCEAIHGGGKACCFRCCAQDSAKGFRGPAVILQS